MGFFCTPVFVSKTLQLLWGEVQTDKVLLSSVEPERTRQELLVLHMPRNDFQHCLFHHLSRDEMTCHGLGSPSAFSKDRRGNSKGTENVCMR